TKDETTDDSVIVETTSPTASIHNNASRNTRSLSQIGSGTLIIDATNRIYRSTHGFDDVGEVTLMAETVIIRSEWRLKQTHVTIRARTLRFEGAGQIITTPAQITKLPVDATGPEGGSNGDNGTPAGRVDLLVENYSDAGDGPTLRFMLMGANGQDAGRGKHGANGRSVPSWPKVTFNTPASNYVYQPTDGYEVTYVNRSSWYGSSVLSGAVDLPTAGSDAWKSGRPGDGGRGGSFTSSVQIPSGRTYLGGGIPGKPGVPEPYVIVGSGESHTSEVVCEGGAAGSPRKAEWLTISEPFLAPVKFINLRMADVADGKSYPVPEGSPGDSGRYDIIPNPFGWVHPVLLRKILVDIRRDYLANRIDVTRTRLQEYLGILERFRESASAWGKLEQTDRLELGQIRDEMRRLYQQAVHGLDYFGNPAGWVPMLSLEYATSLFDQEIDRSLDIIYLARWIQSRQANAALTAQALEVARTKLTDEITDAQAKYADATKQLSTYQAKAESITEQLAIIQDKLQRKEMALADQAEANTQPPEWETGLRVTLKVVGIGAKMIPAYQPALGAVGDAANLASDFDPEQPWDSIKQIPDIASTYAKARADKLAADQAEKLSIASMNPQDLAAHNAHAKRMGRLEDIGNASSQISEGMKGISDLLQKSQVPNVILEAELEKLKAADAEFISLGDEIKRLLEDKRVFADNIVAAFNEAFGYSDTIARNLLAIDSLNTQAGEALQLLDQRVQSHLQDMEQRAWDRLLKYHYYVAKAYEYRMVKPYTQPLDLSEMYKRVAEIADASRNNGNSGALNSSPNDLDRKSLHALYHDLIATTTAKIISDFQNSINSYQKAQIIPVPFNSAQIAALNRGEAVTLNLVEQNRFSAEEEDIRIRNVFISEASDLGTQGVPLEGETSYAQLNIEHSGLSNIRKNGTVHQFRHYTQNAVSPIAWRPRITLDAHSAPKLKTDGALDLSASDSLLLSLAKVPDASGLLLYSSPSAWADLKVWREVKNGPTYGLGNSNATITITNVTLYVSYDYTRKPVNQQIVEVLFAQPEDRTASRPADENDALAPEVLVSASDLNHRKNAVGRFVRIYDKAATPQVTVTVPARIGALEFWKWTDNAVTVPNSTPALTVATTDSHRLVAHYTAVYPASYRQDFDGINPANGLADGSELTSNTGVAGIVAGPSGGQVLKLTDLANSVTRSEWVMQRLRPSVYGFVANFEYQILSPPGGSPADGFGFYLKPATEPTDVANQVGGYARGLGVEFASFGLPGISIRAQNSLLPQRHAVSPASDALRHRVQIRYRTAPGQSGGVVSVLLDGNLVLLDVPVSFVPAKDDVFGFTARTSGFAQTTLIDNVQITPLESPLVVNDVNDAPSFTFGPDQTVNSSSGPQSVEGWATAISAGPADESAQTLAFLVSVDQPSIFTTAPAIDPTGKLTYTPATGANGTAVVTVRLKDNGGTADGGVDTSSAQTFRITVETPAPKEPNKAPSFAKGPDLTVNSAGGTRTFNGWASAISAGAPDESAQTVVFLVSVDQPELFAELPAIDPTGTLTYTPAINANGMAAVTVRLKDNGGTANGGVDTSPVQTFHITIASPVVSDFLVTNTNDSGPGSLRQALTVAAAKPGADRVLFASGLQGPIQLATVIDIADADGVSVDASSEPTGITLSGGKAHRLFTIAAGSKAEFRRLRLTDGVVVGNYPEGYGGAVFVEGTLTLVECSLTGNTAFAGGAVGIASNGTSLLVAERCTFAGNTADHGGVVQVEGVLKATSSTFAGNIANIAGGAISAPFGHEVHLTHCTVSGNSAGQQGGGAYGDNVTLQYSI
ncbi:MAG: hypothetical protein IT581_18805, partial [Verrucomicrobiales bacterium]|nr:hypothetical protein [Verrucomicrobiales bacterium]